MRAREALQLPEVWSRLTKGTPDNLTRMKTAKSIAHMLRRQRWMDLLVAFGATDEAANLLHPRREHARDRED
jgi:hypothetical protein